MEHIEQLVWEFLENLNFDLENDNETSELCNELLDNILSKIKQGYVNNLIK